MAPSRGCRLLWCLSGASSVDSLDSNILENRLPPRMKNSNTVTDDIYEGLNSSTSSPALGAGPQQLASASTLEAWHGRGDALGVGDGSMREHSTSVVPFSQDSIPGLVRAQHSENRPPVQLLRPGHHRTSELAHGSLESFIEASRMEPCTRADSELLTGQQLHQLGFKLYNANNVSFLPGANVQPLTFLVLDIAVVPEAQVARGRGSHLAAGDPLKHSRQYRNRLVPVYTNSCCRSYFDISSHGHYVAVIQKLLKRDPLLSFALQKAVRNLRTGDMRHVSHVMPDPSGQTSSLYGIRLSPCVWRHETGILPSLMIEHKLPYDPDVVMPRLMRDYAVLSHVPAILTLIDFEGKVLYQNASSLEYMGDLLNAKYNKQVEEGMLQVLFMFDLHSLEAMLQDVLGGEEWQGVVQVPYSLLHCLNNQQDADTIIDFARMLGLALGELAGGQVQDDGEDEQFQIGGGRNMRKAAPQPPFLTKQGSLTRGDRGREGSPSDAGVASPDGTEPRRSSLLELVPGLQQRRFMSLLDKQAPLSRAPPAGSPKQAPPSRAQRPREGPGLALEVLGVEQRVDEADEDEGGEEEEELELELDPECFHEVHAIPLLDPVLDKQVIMLVQTDVTPRVELENKLADLTDAQLSMLEQLFPRHIIEYMLARVPNKGSTAGRNLRDLANKHEQVMVLFCDVVGFTSMSKEVEASQVMHFLNELYETFDSLVDKHSMYKLDIVGDCYIVVAGLIKEDQDGFVCVDELGPEQIARNACNILQFGKAMLQTAMTTPVRMPHNNAPVSLRIGIHTGPVVSGLVGSKMPKFTLFGDTMNTASRMESTCQLGCIHVSETFAKLLPNEKWESTGGVEVKGKGLMSTFLWVPDPTQPPLVNGATEMEAARGQTLTKSNTMQSSISNKSRLISRSNSARRRESQSSGTDCLNGSQSLTPLLTILDNIRGGDSDSNGDASPGLGGLSRPKSGRIRLRGARASSNVLGESQEMTIDLRRGALTDGGFSASVKVMFDSSTSLRIVPRRAAAARSSAHSRRASYVEK